MYPLNLSIGVGRWQVFSGRRADPAFFPLRDKVLKRDGHTCQFCGFQAQEYQEIVNLDGDYRNHQFKNLATACVFCTQSLFLEAVGTTFGGGKLIYLPEMTQSALNSLCHVLFCAMTNKTDYMDTAQTAYRNLRLRSQAVEEKVGTNTSDPEVFCQLILNNSVEVDQKKLFEEIKLLPSYARFKEQLEAWAQAAIEELSQGE